VSDKRLSLLSNGHVRYELKTPYRDGTTHVIFVPLDFIARRGDSSVHFDGCALADVTGAASVRTWHFEVGRCCTARGNNRH